MQLLHKIKILILGLSLLALSNVTFAALLSPGNTLYPTYIVTPNNLVNVDDIVTPNNLTIDEGGSLTLTFDYYDTYDYLYFQYEGSGFSEGDILDVYVNNELVWISELKLDPIDGTITAQGHEGWIDISSFNIISYGNLFTLSFFGDGIDGGSYSLSNFDLLNSDPAKVPEPDTIMLILTALLLLVSTAKKPRQGN